MSTPHPPSTQVLDAFGLTGTPSSLAGGNGDSFLVDQIILKPADDILKVEWCAQVQSQLAQLKNPLYRIAQPLAVDGCDPPQYVAHGWTATRLIAGKASNEIRIKGLLPAARTMHEDLKMIVWEQPAWMATQSDRWTLADRLAWNEISWHEVKDVDQHVFDKVKSWLDRLAVLKLPLKNPQAQKQIVHGDLSGNILYTAPEDDEKVSGIIDFSPYWRPVEYAEAIVVADAASWYDNGEEVARAVGVSFERLQMLVRALLFRIATHAIQTDTSEHLRAVFPREKFESAVVKVEKLCREQDERG